MFVGHFAASVAAKVAAPKLPFWACVGAAQLVDIAWAGLVIAGVERIEIDESLAGSPLVLSFMPYTHSLPAAVIWAVLAGALAVWLWGRAGVWIGAVVFSHWLADLLVHRPDLPLGFTGPKVGFGLWDLPVLEMIVELGLLGVAVAVWTGQRGASGGRNGVVLGWFGVLLGLAGVNALPGDAPTPVGLGMLALFAFAVAILAGWLVDRVDAGIRGRAGRR